MPEAFSPLEFLDHVRRNRAIPAWIAGTSLLAAIVVSLALADKYTATANILIDPPSASDPRISTAVSPIYLESLKTYEQFAASDTLFIRACDKFQLLDAKGNQPVESFKKRVLEVRKLKETKLLQISVTLPDAKRAQAVAQYLAEQTVALSVGISEAHDRQVLAQARSELAGAAKALGEERNRAHQGIAGSIDVLEAEINSLSHAASSITAQLGEADGMAAEAAARFTEMTQAKSPDTEYFRREAAAARAKAEALKTREQTIESTLQRKGALLAKAKAAQAENDALVRSAEGAYDQLARRVAELDAAVGTRSEQLRIVDPGTVPQKPSSPNLLLNCVAAFVSSLVIAAAVLCLTFSVERQRLAHQRPPLQVARRGTA